jgi:trans-2-enoyl-CoA reductase
MSSLCLLISENGSPPEVIRTAPHDLPDLDPNDVRVRIRYAPINPADLNVIQGNYGRKPNLPCIPGHEASGVVEAIGSEVTSLAVGDHVIPLLGVGTWSQHMVAPEQFFALLPPDIDLAQAAMLRINPVTAWLLLKEFVPLLEGDWIAQNAGNSAVGRALIQIAATLGIRTLSFVRRADLIPELEAQGATAVFTDDAEGHAAARERLGTSPVRLAANAVSGDSAIRLMNLLAPGGTLVTYGAMSLKSLKVPNAFLIFKDLHLRGLWVSRWFETAAPEALLHALAPLADLMLAGKLHLPVQAIIPFQNAPEALALAAQPHRSGKILLDFTAE